MLLRLERGRWIAFAVGVLAIASAPFALVGCSAFTTGPLSNETGDASADGKTTMTPVEVTDGGESAGGDGGDAASGKVDGSSSVAFCASDAGHVLCDDFDDGATAWTRWDGSSTSNGGTLLRTKSRFVSSPQSLEVTATNTNAEARLSKNYSSVSTARCAFEIFVQATSGDRASILELSNANVFGFIFTLQNQGIVFFDGSLGSQVGALPFQTWAHVDIDYKIGVGIELRINGNNRGDFKSSGETKNRSDALGSPTFYAGISRTGGAGAWDVFLDNVVCDAIK